MKKYAKTILKVIVSGTFLFWVIFKVDWPSVWRNISEISWPYLILYAGAVLFGMLICVYKWKMLADYKKIRMNFGDFFKLYLAGTFINNFMPSFVGGDTFKVYETGKPEKKYIEAASSVMMDRITGLFAAVILAIVFTFINWKSVISNPTLLAVNALVWISFFVGIVIILVRKKSFWSYFKKFLPEKVTAFIVDLETYSSGKGILKKTILLGMAFDFVGIALANYILFVSLGVRINLVDYFSVIFLISIIASAPISINNIGVKEWAYISFFGAFGLTASSVVTVAIVSRFIQMLISFFALPVYLQSRSSKN